MKREPSALAVLSGCLLFGCASHPPRIEYAAGPGPHAFDCQAPPRYYNDFHIHAPNAKLTVTGVMQIVAVAEHPDSQWDSGANVSLVGETDLPWVGLSGFVLPGSRDKIHFTLRWGSEPSQQLPSFAVANIDGKPIHFQISLDESYQLTVSLSTADVLAGKIIFVPPFKIVRASLYCSGAHVRYSNVVVSAQ